MGSKLTNDHTLAASLRDANLFQTEDLYSSPKRDQHYRYLGQSSQVAVDLYQCDVAVNDLVLLCTDGLWHMLRDERLADFLLKGQGDDTQKIARALMDAANAAGGEGNVSAIVVRVQ